ncbi:ABC transporter permease [Deinococcus cellulosilyticus]|uniref:Multidrug ABC transporter permease n=1 Tax=Deinococcus cellulosilyticus (strain DSM 18568 / NBRC 106333 / KACC 11606 / 5516J-15) TaxID=1223518 RepID=A0A511N5U0_DEIC1|nr:ABC transporter permease [Deinococcus cellulosilyticus]GEM47806.1 multidrug ABC transporter permease [Deinococcus cellulosilyticus NBRC 106333 = KACC 11606]
MIGLLQAEALKYRRTPTLLLSIGVPIGLGLLIWAVLTFGSGMSSLKGPAGWKMLGEFMTQMWMQMVLPFGAAIISSQVWGLETQDNHLKHLLVQPITRTQVYFTKLIALIALIGLGILVMGLVYLGIGGIRGFGEGQQVLTLLKNLGLTGLVALPLVTLHLWISMRVKAMTLNISLAVLGVMAAGFAAGSKFWYYIPWTYAPAVLSPKFHDMALILGGSVTLVLILLSVLDFRRRDLH